MIIFACTILLLVAALFSQFWFPGRARVFQVIFLFSIVVICSLYLLLVYLQYATWKEAGPPSSFLIPPYRSALYVFSYHFMRFGLWYVISLALALAFFAFGTFLNKKFGEKFFRPEEMNLAALAIFCLGNPEWKYAWLYYFFALGIISVIGALALRYAFRSPRRFSFYWLWIPTAIGVIIGMSILQFLISNF
ncbi:MAG: hypothetical protein AAB634_00555 [Patescibacteria group bacterium]